MKRTTVMIPEDLKIQAVKHANLAGISLGGFIRKALERALEPPNGDKLADDPFFTDRVVFNGETPSDLARNHDEYLYGDRS